MARTKRVKAQENGGSLRQGGSLSEAEGAAPVTRRSFLKMILQGLGALTALEIGGVGLLYLKPRALKEQFGGVITAGQVADFPPGSVTEYPDGRFFLVRDHGGGFMAVYYRCPHLGCTVDWVAEDERFYCPCHASSFDIRGSYENAPVTRALDVFAVEIKDEQVLVDTSKMVQREKFTPDQLVYVKG